MSDDINDNELPQLIKESESEDEEENSPLIEHHSPKQQPQKPQEPPQPQEPLEDQENDDEKIMIVDCFLHPRVIHELKDYFPTSRLIAEYLGEIARNISVKPISISMYMDHNHSLIGQFYFTVHPSDAPSIRELFDSFVLLTSLPKPGSLI